MHDQFYLCSITGKINTFYCPDVAAQSVILLPADSPFWKLTPEKRAEYLGNYVWLQPSIPVRDLTPDMPEYADYYCTTHTKNWYDNSVARQGAIDAANAQISESQAVLGDPTLTIPLEERNSLSALITELQGFIASSDATVGAIEQKMSSLKILTDQLKALYPALPAAP